tara:strand:+ start:299 stop:478 length:180 start_codon:yes stop_codon:yes gene_type:complete
MNKYTYKSNGQIPMFGWNNLVQAINMPKKQHHDNFTKFRLKELTNRVNLFLSIIDVNEI